MFEAAQVKIQFCNWVFLNKETNNIITADRIIELANIPSIKHRSIPVEAKVCLVSQAHVPSEAAQQEEDRAAPAEPGFEARFPMEGYSGVVEVWCD